MDIEEKGIIESTFCRYYERENEQLRSRLAIAEKVVEAAKVSVNRSNWLEICAALRAYDAAPKEKG